MILFQEENKLCMRLAEEFLEIEAWGTNALRVRATRNVRFSEAKKGIDYVAPSNVKICIDEGKGSIQNGKITCALSETMISGNIGDLLKNIRAISKETVADGNSVLPAIAFDGVTVSGQ